MNEFFLGMFTGVFLLVIVLGVLANFFGPTEPLSNDEIIQTIRDCEQYKSADLDFVVLKGKIVGIECSMKAVTVK